MNINKAQGHMLRRTGLYLSELFFNEFIDSVTYICVEDTHTAKK